MSPVGTPQPGKSDSLFSGPLPGKPVPLRAGFKCMTCGDHAMFGYGVNLLGGTIGRWYCAEHAIRVESK